MGIGGATLSCSCVVGVISSKYIVLEKYNISFAEAVNTMYRNDKYPVYIYDSVHVQIPYYAKHLTVHLQLPLPLIQTPHA